MKILLCNMSKKYETSSHDYVGLFYLAGALEKAGFTVEAVKGDFTDADVTAEHDAIVYFARK